MLDTINLVLRLTLILMVIWALGDLINASPAGWVVKTGKSIVEFVQ